jgi:oligopeptide transport system permease protein
MFYASLGTLGVFLGDLMMAFIDPRIKLSSKGATR